MSKKLQKEILMDPNDLLVNQAKEKKDYIRRELTYSSAQKTEDGWYNAEAGLGIQLADGQTRGLIPHPDDKPQRDASLFKGPNASAQAGAGNGRIGAFVQPELFRMSAANSWGQTDLALNLKTGIQLGSHNEVKIAGCGVEIGKDGIGISIFGIGGKLKFW